MQLTGTLKSIIDFSNFFDQQLYVYYDKSHAFFAIKNGVSKRIKFPDHLKKILADKQTISKPITNGGEKSVLHIYRLGDGHTLFLTDPGTGNVLNGFVLSLITLSSNVCSVESDTSDGDTNQVLLDKLVAEFDREKKKFAVIDKRQKEEIIILEEQAKDAYNQMALLENEIKKKDSELSKLKKQLAEVAENYKSTEKKLTDMQYTTDFQVGAELKKRNEELKIHNKKLATMLKKSTTSITELHSEIDMYVIDFMTRAEIPEDMQKEMTETIKDLFKSGDVVFA